MSEIATSTDLRRLHRHVRGLWLAVLALGALVAASNREVLAEYMPASMAGPSFAGTWEGEFKMTQVELGGVFPIKPHLVSVSLTLTERDGVIEGIGAAENILGDFAILAFVKGPQRGTVHGVVAEEASEITLDIPPFGSPPAPAYVVVRGSVSEDRIEGTCKVSIAGGESAAVPCKLARRIDASPPGEP